MDGRSYRWRVRPDPTDTEGAHAGALTFTVHAEDGGSVLMVEPGGPRPDNWLGRRGVVVTPAVAAAAVRRAIAAGWQPGELGSAFSLRYDPDDAPPD